MGSHWPRRKGRRATRTDERRACSGFSRSREACSVHWLASTIAIGMYAKIRNAVVILFGSWSTKSAENRTGHPSFISLSALLGLGISPQLSGR